MIKAVIIDGAIQPLEPLPADWHEGQALRVEKADSEEACVEEIDRDFAELAALCEAQETIDEQLLEHARPPLMTRRTRLYSSQKK